MKLTIGDATLYLGDCLEILPTLPKVDAVITDPPYLNLTGGGNLPQGGVGGRNKDSITLGDEWGASLEWAPLAQALAAKGLMVFCGHQGVCETRAAFSSARSLALVTWYKRNTPAAMKWVPRHTAEFIWILATGGGLDWHRISTVIDIPNINAGCVSTGERLTKPDGSVAHPSQKPLQLMRWLLGVNPASVLDPFMGTGTTGVACALSGRSSFVGIEREPKYFDIACRRIEQAYAQGRLFDGPTVQEQTAFL